MSVLSGTTTDLGGVRSRANGQIAGGKSVTNVVPAYLNRANGHRISYVFSCAPVLYFLLFIFIHVRMSVCNFVHSRELGAQLWAIFDDEL